MMTTKLKSNEKMTKAENWWS